jgi:hypothetical protein
MKPKDGKGALAGSGFVVAAAPKALPNPLPNRLSLGVAGLTRSSLAVPSPLKVVPSLNPPDGIPDVPAFDGAGSAGFVVADESSSMVSSLDKDGLLNSESVPDGLPKLKLLPVEPSVAVEPIETSFGMLGFC